MASVVVSTTTRSGPVAAARRLINAGTAAIVSLAVPPSCRFAITQAPAAAASTPPAAKIAPCRRVAIPTMRGSRSKSSRRTSRRSASNSANRRPTWPKPTSARSARMRAQPCAPSADRVQHLADALERRQQELEIAAEANPQIAVHLEMIAGHEEDALFLAYPLAQRRRANRQRVFDEGDRARFGRDVRQHRRPAFNPSPDRRVVR